MRIKGILHAIQGNTALLNIDNGKTIYFKYKRAKCRKQGKMYNQFAANSNGEATSSEIDILIPCEISELLGMRVDVSYFIKNYDFTSTGGKKGRYFDATNIETY